MSKEFQRYVVTRVKRAIVDYGMIADGDRVAVGLSGGKDSSVLLHILNLVRRVAPIKFFPARHLCRSPAGTWK